MQACFNSGYDVKLDSFLKNSKTNSFRKHSMKLNFWISEKQKESASTSKSLNNAKMFSERFIMKGVGVGMFSKLANEMAGRDAKCLKVGVFYAVACVLQTKSVEVAFELWPLVKKTKITHPQCIKTLFICAIFFLN